mmetsp:Transcript_16319/g.32646  ORF Transcript_16319/g.32646 Transcript_16319/m.32646 type:complete len:219 (-) Transcript_16319:47-703(-)
MDLIQRMEPRWIVMTHAMRHKFLPSRVCNKNKATLPRQSTRPRQSLNGTTFLIQAVDHSHLSLTSLRGMGQRIRLRKTTMKLRKSIRLLFQQTRKTAIPQKTDHRSTWSSRYASMTSRLTRQRRSFPRSPSRCPLVKARVFQLMVRTRKRSSCAECRWQSTACCTLGWPAARCFGCPMIMRIRMRTRSQPCITGTHRLILRTALLDWRMYSLHSQLSE